MTDKKSSDTKPTGAKETARELAERASRENPELFKEAPKTGQGFIIGGGEADRYAMNHLTLPPVVLILATAIANAAWVERTTTDRLTDQNKVQMETAALAPISQYGRTIVPRLTLQCLRPSGAAPYLGAFIVFGEPVAVVPDVRMRLRFDDNEVENRILGSSSRSDYVQIVAPDTFVVDHFPGSSRLRIDFPLLAGNAFIEFNTKGADAAIKRAQCG